MEFLKTNKGALIPLSYIKQLVVANDPSTNYLCIRFKTLDGVMHYTKGINTRINSIEYLLNKSIIRCKKN